MFISNNSHFSPECLTISLGEKCNLNCLYCFSKDDASPKKQIPNEIEFLKAISKASELVARNCRRKKMPFFLGYQGSGEPLIYFDKLQKTYALVAEIARKHRLRLVAFITSNGCLEREKYQWVASHFNRICLSIDGDESINDIQRRTRDDKGTYQRIVETVDMLKQHQKIPVVRTTVTQHNVPYLVVMVRHFIEELKLNDIQMEPVYRVSTNQALAPAPEAFVENYLQAKKQAAKSGGILNYSGYRSNEKHSAYCNTHKNVLFIGPTGNASICLFKDHEGGDSHFVFGYYDTEHDRYIIDEQRIEQLQRKTSGVYTDCENCEIVDSCVKGCPDACLIENDPNYDITKSLRCQINRLLAEREF